MNLHQLATSEDPQQRPVSTHVGALADQVPRDRVERLGDLDMMIAVHLGGRVDRHVVGLGRRRPQPWLLLDAEHVGRAGLDGAVDPHPGSLPTPRLGAALGVDEIDEGLAGEEALAHERHHPLYPGLVCGERTRAGSTTTPRNCAYSTNAWFRRGSIASACSTIALRLSGITAANTPQRTPTPLHSRRSRR
jgi:hypothetical protein